MKAIHLFTVASTMAFLGITGCSTSAEEETLQASASQTEDATTTTDDGTSQCRYIDQLPLEDLSEGEIGALKFMREEEKLARDVYLTLYDQWQLLPFKNISKSEQAHMNAMLYLLDRYGIEDPANGNGVGVFENEELQQMYNDLIARGSESVIEALKVGALIEETDIEDIQRLIDEEVDNQDIDRVFSNLLRGSTFHLKAFYGNLQVRNVDYRPVVLEESVFYDIVE
jgi:hypothetical protein